MAIIGKFPGVTGECRLDGKTGYVDIASYSDGFFTPISMSGDGLSGGKTELHSVGLTVVAGSHIPALMKNGAGGKHFATVTIEMLLQDGEQLQKYKEITLEVAAIESNNSGDHGSSNEKGMENLTLKVAKITKEYFGQNDQGQTASKGKVIIDQKAGTVTV